MGHFSSASTATEPHAATIQSSTAAPPCGSVDSMPRSRSSLGQSLYSDGAYIDSATRQKETFSPLKLRLQKSLEFLPIRIRREYGSRQQVSLAGDGHCYGASPIADCCDNKASTAACSLQFPRVSGSFPCDLLDLTAKTYLFSFRGTTQPSRP